MNWKEQSLKETMLMAAAALAVASAVMGRAADGVVPTNAAPAPQVDTNAAVKVVQPAQIELPAALTEVIRLAESGAQDSVIVAYIQKSPGYRITSDQIVYLQDLGISQSVIKTLVEHGQSAAESVVPPVPEPTLAVTNEPATTPVPEPEPVAGATAPETTVTYFYQSLSPYGSWVDVPAYGLCWQPTVVLVNPAWRPYCDNGYWLWSDQGWYWRSYYSWGWAPFHYGRWFQHPYRGWIWWPDRVWGPSWVSWRNAPGYCGWAPLPPRSHFSAGVGWTFNGVAVGLNSSFGLGPSQYTFVPPAYFAHRRVAAHALPLRQVNTVFNNTTVINNYVVGSNNRIINQGIDRRQIQTATRVALPEVQVRELPRQGSRFPAPDQVTRVGNSEVIYRPAQQSSVPPAPRIPRPATPVNRPVSTRQPAITAPAPASARPTQVPQNVPRRPTTLESKPAERLMPGADRPALIPTPSRPQPQEPATQPRPAPAAPQLQRKPTPDQREQRGAVSSLQGAAAAGSSSVPSRSNPTYAPNQRSGVESHRSASAAQPALPARPQGRKDGDTSHVRIRHGFRFS
jgi:hypothetical protein